MFNFTFVFLLEVNIFISLCLSKKNSLDEEIHIGSDGVISEYSILSLPIFLYIMLLHTNELISISSYNILILLYSFRLFEISVVELIV